MGFVPAAKQPEHEDPKKPSLYEGQRRLTLEKVKHQSFQNKITSGQYVKKEQVDRDFFRLGREMREGFENLPSRVCAQIQAEAISAAMNALATGEFTTEQVARIRAALECFNQQKCFDLIKAEVDQILEGLTRGRAA